MHLFEQISDPASLALQLYKRDMIPQIIRNKAISNQDSSSVACRSLLVNEIERQIEADGSKLIDFALVFKDTSDLQLVGSLLIRRLCKWFILRHF